jgi:hypothetical protein
MYKAIQTESNIHNKIRYKMSFNKEKKPLSNETDDEKKNDFRLDIVVSSV